MMYRVILMRRHKQPNGVPTQGAEWNMVGLVETFMVEADCGAVAEEKVEAIRPVTTHQSRGDFQYQWRANEALVVAEGVWRS